MVTHCSDFINRGNQLATLPCNVNMLNQGYFKGDYSPVLDMYRVFNF